MSISIHVPREGDDRGSGAVVPATQNFYPRPPRGGRPVNIGIEETKSKFLSTSPARGTTCNFAGTLRQPHISIHVPREGDDRRTD